MRNEITKERQKYDCSIKCSMLIAATVAQNLWTGRTGSATGDSDGTDV